MSKEFIWDDEKVEKYAETHQFQSIEDFKKQFSPKPEWEIVRSKTANGYTFPGNYYSPNRIILTVRRISDNEEFSIGDVHKATSAHRKNWPAYKITGFRIVGDTMVADNDGNSANPLNEIEKVKEPIPAFVSDDGVPVFPDQNFWVVAPKTSFGWAPVRLICEDKTNKKHPSFSTKEAAEDYILVHKPCLSIWDIVINISPASTANSIAKQLKSIVKSKIKTDQ